MYVAVCVIVEDVFKRFGVITANSTAGVHVKPPGVQVGEQKTVGCGQCVDSSVVDNFECSPILMKLVFLRAVMGE